MITQQQETIELVTSAIDTSELLREIHESVVEVVQNALHGEERLKIEIAKWPPNFARILLASGVECFESVREAVRRYRELSLDIRFAELLRDEGCSLLREKINELAVRLKRQLYYIKNTLDEFNVSVIDLEPGTSFDETYHEPVKKVETSDPELIYKIEAVESPLFKWTDNKGTDQWINAQVAVFVEPARSIDVELED